MTFEKDLLGIKNLSVDQINEILKNAKIMKTLLQQNNKKGPHLQGKSVITLFYENSTRTRLSFELASKYLSANAANVAVASSSVQKGESLIDTARTIDMMGTDVLIIRHSSAGAPHLVAQNVDASVINAGDGMNEHPTQALLDAFTMVEKKGKLEGLKVAIVGDILHSRVARSNIYLLNKFGAEVVVAGPSTLMPYEIEKLGVKAYTDVEKALKNADVVMGLRIQLERQKTGLFPSIDEYSEIFGVNDERLKLAKEDAIIMHPGPVNRGVEISSSLYDHERSFIDEQVQNGVAVRMAVLYLLTRKEK
ncbi:aspartate carbamoyltransferase catalytic subunit [Acetivibrio sp. MSJd-27]|jgi:aspartate carbamoyltransferase|uniref:aspartate carbamoyltransferase catalytic subunit n=1 Tax=Acetivibrio sp. MSJd-27 TaxID=2841523 RepID=UPI001C0F8A66|nr:aspartate carbamoyltransferase catalytic subunit [Acetivibrio sp. MSJd-27]MBU5449714.1 aspartate carbamoyltransferase catalytic subunit [Acetivibrio sp. MSJd-27]